MVGCTAVARWQGILQRRVLSVLALALCPQADNEADIPQDSEELAAAKEILALVEGLKSP